MTQTHNTGEPVSYDLVLRGGRVFDTTLAPTPTVLDIAITGGRVEAVAPHVDGAGKREIDCTDRVVTPGLLDVHVHCFEGMLMNVGMSSYDATLRRGVVGCVDAGTSGASNFRGFRRFVADGNEARVLAFLNVSVLGVTDTRHGELPDASVIHVDDAVNAAKANPSIIRGFKVRLSRNVASEPAKSLDLAREIADLAGLPLMVHISKTDIGIDDILARLAPGDVVTHVFTGLEGGILANGSVRPAAWAARERGVLFDIGHGRTQFDHRVARIALDEGFVPDFLGSDLSNGNQFGPAFDLPTVMAKMVTLGMPMERVVAATTLRAAEFLGLRDEGYGAITVGDPAFVTVMEQLDHADSLPDASGSELQVRRLEPLFAVNRGVVHDSDPWRGGQPEPPAEW
ncbi:amidohydrolase/deacetylase family metallohydrolase [Acrocarpospora macrocephala]|uniref:Amidohydrolase n=1 Tax=Acrocarpospora macrocephala TaxID=150177 RepID=A0A5M3WMJ4_9ACTN|nr:amidohydrolase family protein [Acrocarpospora macrocephala]GES09720.1 amidohydrolase [Acrocarpospora macrocephala]